MNKSQKVRQELYLIRKELEGSDKEVAHIKADECLCKFLKELGYHDVVKEFEKLEKWYA